MTSLGKGGEEEVSRSGCMMTVVANGRRGVVAVCMTVVANGDFVAAVRRGHDPRPVVSEWRLTNKRVGAG